MDRAKKDLAQTYPLPAIAVLARYLGIETAKDYDQLLSQIVVRVVTNHKIGRMLPENDLEKLFFLFPNEAWNYNFLVSNPNLTPKMIKYIVDKGIDFEDEEYVDFWYNVSANEGMTLEIIRSNPDFEWDSSGLSQNPNVTPEFIEDHSEFEWNYSDLALNKNLTLDFIRRHWEDFENDDSVYLLLKHHSVTWDFIQDHADYIKLYPEYVSANPNITPQIVETNTDIPWDWGSFAYNKKTATIPFVEKHINKNWDWSGLSFNIPWNDIKSRIDIDSLKKGQWIKKYKLWNWWWPAISKNRTVTPKVIDEYPLLPWDWDALSYNPNIDVQFIEKHFTKGWYWPALSRHPRVTWDDIQRHQNWPWTPQEVSSNPNLTWKIVRDNADFDWDWSGLSRNRFKRIVAATVLQNFYRDYVKRRVQRRREGAQRIAQGFREEWWAPGAPGFEMARRHFHGDASVDF